MTNTITGTPVNADVAWLLARIKELEAVERRLRGENKRLREREAYLSEELEAMTHEELFEKCTGIRYYQGEIAASIGRLHNEDNTWCFNVPQRRELGSLIEVISCATFAEAEARLIEWLKGENIGRMGNGRTE